MRRPTTDAAGRTVGSGTEGGPELATMKLSKRYRRSKRGELYRNDRCDCRCGHKRCKFGVETVQIGTLICSLSSSIGLVIGSQRNVSCLFRGAPGEPDEPYTGTMTRVGLDVGLTTGSVIIWAMFANIALQEKT
jgi:hypothetical protein